jgi:hypothetical protein
MNSAIRIVWTIATASAACLLAGVAAQAQPAGDVCVVAYQPRPFDISIVADQTSPFDGTLGVAPARPHDDMIVDTRVRRLSDIGIADPVRRLDDIAEADPVRRLDDVIIADHAPTPEEISVASLTEPASDVTVAPFQHCSEDDDWCSCRHFFANAESVWLAPLNQQQTGTFQILDSTGAPISQFSSQAAAAEGLIATPRITLGIQRDCWGIRTRYWRMEESKNVNGLDPNLGIGLVTQGAFAMETLDLEGTRYFDVGCNTMQLAFGVRYAQFRQSAGVSNSQIINGDIYSGFAQSRFNFSGVGITSALSGIHPLGCNFNLYFSLRGSVVWDQHPVTSVQTEATYISSINGFGQSFDMASGSGSGSSMFIGEAQIGGQWNYALQCFPADVFVRIAFEYQYWGASDVGDASAFSFAGPINGTNLALARAQSGDAFTNLVGFNIGTGFVW